MIDGLRTLGIAAVAATTIGLVHGSLTTTHYRVRETADVYVLPPPDDVVKLSLGYRAALVDMLWAHVLVSQGLHTAERRRFENLTLLLDTINELEPTFREPYLMADALITFQTGTTPENEVRKAREIMERGTRNRPYDAEVWLVAGEFTSFVAPGSYLSDPEEGKRWRIEGTRMLERAAELGADDARITWQALGGASILERAGDREASIRFRQRALAVTDDEELRKKITAELERLLGEEFKEKRKARDSAFQRLCQAQIPWMKKTLCHALGPPIDAPYCGGGRHDEEPRCSTTWRAWSERLMDAQPAQGFDDSGKR